MDVWNFRLEILAIQPRLRNELTVAAGHMKILGIQQLWALESNASFIV